jgi:ribonucleoside-diphosphate reductase alpha chain
MQATLQPYVDGAISKTVNLPLGCSVEEVERLVSAADASELKGITVFPATSPIGEILIADGPDATAHCDAPTCKVL